MFALGYVSFCRVQTNFFENEARLIKIQVTSDERLELILKIVTSSIQRQYRRTIIRKISALFNLVRYKKK